MGTAVCSKAGMVPVCHHHTHYRVDGCALPPNAGSDPVEYMSYKLCGDTGYRNCPLLQGVFVAMNYSGGEWGVMSDGGVIGGNGYTSGPGTVYTASTMVGQYSALCAHSR